MNRLILSKIEELKYKLNDDYTNTTSDTNNNATKTYNTISKVTQEVTTIKNKIGVLSDMFTDLRVLNGTAKNIINLSTVPIVENNGIKISNDKFELDTSIKNRKEISVKDSSISSLEKYTLTTSNNKKTDIDSFLKTAIDATITFPTTRYTFNLNLRYTSLEQINSIEIQLGLLTESYPLINSIKYIDKDNIEQTAIILNNTSTNYDLDYYREVDNKYVIDISSILTDQIIIEFTSKTSSSLMLKDIKTYFKREVETGEITLGPIHTNTPLLKVALDTEDISNGASFEFSTDQEYWLKLDSSSIITSDTNTKILSFNTVNTKSIKTNEDIYTFYIKVSLASSVLTNEDSNVDIYNTVREDNSLNNDVLETIENNLFSVYKVKNSDFIHGDYQFIDNLNIKDFNIKCLEYIEVNGVSKVIGLIETPYSVSSSTTINNGGIGAELKLKRLNANTVSSCVNYDLANAKVYDIYPRDIEETINTRQKDNLCFYLKRKKLPSTETYFSAPYDVTATVTEEDDFSAPYDFNDSIDDISWTLNPEYNIVGDNIEYTGYQTNGIVTYESYASVSLEEAIVKSFSDSDMQQWQAVTDACNELTGTSEWVFDNNTKVIEYIVPQEIVGYGLLDPETNEPTTSTIEKLCSSIIQNQFEDSSNTRNAEYSGFTQVSSEVYCDLTIELFDGYDWNTSTTQANTPLNLYPNDVNTIATIPYQQVANKIVSNSETGNEVVQMLAQTYIEVVAESVFNIDESKQFIKLSDLIPQFEANIYNFSKPLNLKSDYIVDEGLKTTWDSTGYVSTFNYYRSETPIDINNLPNPIIIDSSDSYYTETTHSDKAYYIVVGSLKNGIEKLSEIIKVLDGELLPLTDVTFEVINI